MPVPHKNLRFLITGYLWSRRYDLTDEQKAELDRAIEESEREDAVTYTWEEVKVHLNEKRKEWRAKKRAMPVVGTRIRKRKSSVKAVLKRIADKDRALRNKGINETSFSLWQKEQRALGNLEE